MEDTNDQGVETDVPELPAVEEGKEDTTDWKATALKMQGMAKRFKTKIDKMAGTAKPSNQPAQKTEPDQAKGFDYGQKAYLKASGISDAEFDFVKEQMQSSGFADIDKLLNNGYFQSQLKEHREHAATDAATPPSGKRAAQQTRNDVDYWLTKGGLPKDNPDLARKVVNARMAKENQGRFSDNAVVIGTNIDR